MDNNKVTAIMKPEPWRVCTATTHTHKPTNHVHLNREGPPGNQKKKGEENGRGWLKK